MMLACLREFSGWPRGENPPIKYDQFREKLFAIPTKRRLALLTTSNDLGSVIHKLSASEAALSFLECVGSCLDSESFYKLIRIQDECGRTGLHVAAINGNWKALSYMLHIVPPDCRHLVLAMKDAGSRTPFHCSLLVVANISSKFLAEWLDGDAVLKQLEIILKALPDGHLKDFLKLQSYPDCIPDNLVEIVGAYIESLLAPHKRGKISCC